MFKPNTPGCGCYITTAQELNTCLTRVKWCSKALSATLDIGDGLGPQPVDASGSILTPAPGPYILSGAGCKGTLTCTKAAMAKCGCGYSDPYVPFGTPIIGRRFNLLTRNWAKVSDPCSATCYDITTPANNRRTWHWLSGATSTLTGPVVALAWDFPVDFSPYCGTLLSEFEVFIGSYNLDEYWTLVEERRDLTTGVLGGTLLSTVGTYNNESHQSFDFYFGFGPTVPDGGLDGTNCLGSLLVPYGLFKNIVYTESVVSDTCSTMYFSGSDCIGTTTLRPDMYNQLFSSAIENKRICLNSFDTLYQGSALVTTYWSCIPC